MRIIAGRYRSRVLQAPPGLGTRPTSDRLRETLFNVLAPRVEGARFLDLYAGSGAVGLEALSRGAAHVTFVERAAAAVNVLRGNLEELGVREGYKIQSGSVRGFLERGKRKGELGFDVIYLDPPWDAADEYVGALSLLGGSGGGVIAEGGVVIAEHRKKDRLGAEFGRLQRTRLLEQGDAGLSFYGAKAAG